MILHQDVKGPQTAAFNLPNDERMVKERGTSMVMLKNVTEAKYLWSAELIVTMLLDVLMYFLLVVINQIVFLEKPLNARFLSN